MVRVKLAFSADGGDLPPGRALIPGPQSAPPAAYSEFPEDFPPHPGDIIVVKRHWGAFTGTELDLQLRRRGVTQIVLAGISTSIGVESTARSAWENSYNLIFAEDAITDVDAASHTHTFTKIFPHLARSPQPDRSSTSSTAGPRARIRARSRARRPEDRLPIFPEGAKMPVYDAADIPDTVGRGTLDPELRHGCRPVRSSGPTSRSRRAAATICSLA